MVALSGLEGFACNGRFYETFLPTPWGAKMWRSPERGTSGAHKNSYLKCDIQFKLYPRLTNQQILAIL
jgi:hypothetical protein